MLRSSPSLHKLLGRKIFISIIANFIFMEIILVRVPCACSLTWYVYSDSVIWSQHVRICHLYLLCLPFICQHSLPSMYARWPDSQMRGQQKCPETCREIWWEAHDASRGQLASHVRVRSLATYRTQLPTYAAWPLIGLSFSCTQSGRSPDSCSSPRTQPGR